MKALEIEVGKKYLAEVNGRMCVLRVDRINPYYGADGRSPLTYRYACRNLTSHRNYTVHDAAQFQGVAE